MLSVRADLQVVVDLDPRNLDFGAVFKGSDETRRIRIVGKDAAKTKLTSVTVAPLGAQRNMNPAPEPVVLATLVGEGEDRAVELSIAPDAPSGYFYGQLVVMTDNPKATHLTARIRVKVQSTVSAKPSYLRFSIPEEGGEQTQEIVLRSTDGQPLKVLDVAVHHPAITASFTQMNERRTKISVTFKGTTRLEKETSALLVRTTRTDDPQIQVPVDIFRLRRSAAQSTPAGP